MRRTRPSLIPHHQNMATAHWLEFDYPSILDSLGFKKAATKTLCDIARREAVIWEYAR